MTKLFNFNIIIKAKLLNISLWPNTIVAANQEKVDFAGAVMHEDNLTNISQQ